MSNPYPAEFRERALRMLAGARPDHASDFAAANHVAGRLGVNLETSRLRKKRADIDAGREPGTTSEAQLEIKRLKKQIAELEKASRIARLHAEDYGIDDIRKMHRLRRRQGWEIGRPDRSPHALARAARCQARQSSVHHQI
jgi:transposase